MFQHLAQEAVHSCTVSLLHASKLISQATAASPSAGAGPAGAQSALQGSSLDGLLFLIKHLLILREQILPFKVEFVTTQQVLDFSHIPNTLPNLFNRAGFARGLSSFFALVQQSEPKLTSQKTDSKKDMAQELTRACEQLIRSQTHSLMQRLLAFLHKYQQHTQTPTLAAGTSSGGTVSNVSTAVVAAGTAASAPAASTEPAPAVTGPSPAEADQMKTELALILTSLRSSALNTHGPSAEPSPGSAESKDAGTGRADGDISVEVSAIADNVISNTTAVPSGSSLEGQLRVIRAKLALYLRNPMHENILFKPVKVSVSACMLVVRYYPNTSMCKPNRRTCCAFCIRCGFFASACSLGRISACHSC